MKLGIILVFVIVGTLTSSLTFADETDLEFGSRFLPSKLIEDEEGIIQVYAKIGDILVPEKISDLTVTSLDSSILRVISVKDNGLGFVSEVTVQSVDPGSTKLFLAAPGFSPTEIPVTIYGSKLNKEQLLVKAVPDLFSANGPGRGVLSVELADADGFPIIASEDIPVSLSLSNGIVNIFQQNLVIKKGEYFAGTQFTVQDKGRTTIYATGNGLEGKSNEVKIGETENDLTVSLFVFPEEINISSDRTIGHIIAILHEKSGDGRSDQECDFIADSNRNTRDNECRISLAKQDIKVTYKVSNSVFDNVNTSDDADIGESTGIFMIKKGTYWGHATFDVLGGGENFAGTYDVTISTGNPIALDREEVQAVYQENNNDGSPKQQVGDKFVKLDVLPIFATGNKELIGVVHLEDDEDYPIVAEENLEVKIDSTGPEFVSVDPVTLKTGDGSALVFGTVGISVPDEDDDLELNAAVEVGEDDPQLVEALMFGPDQESLKLVAEPLVSEILSNTDFPIVVYLKDEEGITKFPKSSSLFVSPSDNFDVEQKQAFRGNDLIMLDSSSIGKGSDNLEFTYDDYVTEITLDSLSVKPANMVIDHSETVLTGTNDIFSIQLLNSEELPVFATEDINIDLVVKDQSLLQVPEIVTIKKGDYFTLFDAAPKKTGITEISVLAEGLPLSSSEIKIKDLTPEVEISAPDIVEKGESFVASLTVTQDELPLKDLQVNWNVDGGAVQISDRKTGPTGEALTSIISTSDQKVEIEASVSGSFYTPATISKTIRINATSEFVAFAENGQTDQFSKFEIGGVDPVIIIIPVAIGVVGYMLIRQGALRVRNPQTTQAQIS